MGIASFLLPPAKGAPANVVASEGGESKYLLTAFVPGAGGKPARVDLLRFPDRTGRESSSVAAPG